MDPQRTDQFRPFVIIREDGAAVPVASQGLGREKGCSRDITETSCPSAMETSSKSLGRVFQNIHAITVRNLPDPLIICGQSEKIHRHDYPGLQFPFCQYRLHRPLQTVRIHIKSIFQDVGKYRRRAFIRHGLGRRKESKVRHKDRVSLSDPPCHQGKGQGVRAVGAGNTVFHTHVLRQFCFQLCHRLSADIGGLFQHLSDRGVYLRLQHLILLFQITKFHLTLPL